MAHFFRRREAPPALWQVFAEQWLHLSRTKAEQWWSALQRSRWSQATELRHIVQLHTDVDSNWHQVWSLYQQAMGPAALIATLEDLIQEGQLPPLMARRIESNVLAQTDHTGQWKGSA